MTELKDVYVISDRQQEEKEIWTKVGVAFVNGDQSLNVVLDMIPLTGRLHIRASRNKDTTKKKEQK